MLYALIKYRAQTVNHEYMPLWLYSRPMCVIKETNDTITVQYDKLEFYTFVFKKENIEKCL